MEEATEKNEDFSVSQFKVSGHRMKNVAKVDGATSSESRRVYLSGR